MSQQHPLLSCLLLAWLPGEGAEPSLLEKRKKIIICKPRSWELLGGYLSRGRKRLCSLSAQRLFITLTRGWRKCSICWVQPATHTAYKLRAFTCRVPEIKHTHTHTKKERGVLCRPRRCLSLAVPAPQPRPGPGSRSGIPHYLRAFPASSAGNSSASVFLQPHLESVRPGCQWAGLPGWHVLPPAPCPPRALPGCSVP